MNYKIQDIEGIGPAYAEKLAKAGIENTGQLLEKCGHRSGRAAIAEATGVKEPMLLKWANMADLMRVSGVGGEFAELLEASGVDTIKELRHRSADNLAEKMKQINETKKLTRSVPSSSVIAKWIEASKTVEPSITH